MADNLRQYGPGKFDLIIDEVIYLMSMEGGEEQAGDVETTGFYALVSGPFTKSDINQYAAEAKIELTPDEIRFLKRQAGAILSEDFQGFIGIEYHSKKDELTAAWDAVLEEVEEAEAEEDEEEY